MHVSRHPLDLLCWLHFDVPLAVQSDILYLGDIALAVKIGDIRKMQALTISPSSPIKRGVGRIKINDEQTPARFPEGTLARIDSVLEDKEKRSDFIRDAVDKEILRRLTLKAKQGQALARIKRTPSSRPD
jgi:hypothetical protein